MHDLFQPGVLKVKKNLEWKMNEIFETNIEVAVNVLADINEFLSSLYNYKLANQNNI